MPDPIRADHRGLVDMANQACGYKAVWVGQGDSARRSESGNLVIEHNATGTQDVCRDGRVVAHQTLDRGGLPQNPIPFPSGPRPNNGPNGGDFPHQDPDYPQHGGHDFGGGSFDERLARLKQLYQSTSMTSSEEKALEQDLVHDEMGHLLADRHQPFDSRLAQLNHIYQATSMTSSEKSGYEQQLLNEELRRLIHERNQPIDDRLAALNHLYQRTGMTSADKAGYERQLVDQEVQFLINDRYTPVEQRLTELNHLYQKTSMTSGEKAAYEQQIISGYRP